MTFCICFSGSLVIGTTEAELKQLNKHVQQLTAAGLRAEYLSGDDLALLEPELGVGRESGAAFLPDDCQLDAHRTVAFIEKVIVVILNFGFDSDENCWFLLLLY